jgi:hypothetical protein
MYFGADYRGVSWIFLLSHCSVNMISLPRGGVPTSSSADVGCSVTQVLQILFGRPVCYVQRNIGKYNQTTTILVEDILLCLKYLNNRKLNMYSVWHSSMFIVLIFYYWLLVSASKGHHQANVYVCIYEVCLKSIRPWIFPRTVVMLGRRHFAQRKETA